MNREIKKGYWFEDIFFSFLKGFFPLEETYRDARKFSIEINSVGNNMFPIDKDEKHLVISHSDKTIERDLNNYFISRFSRYRDRLYGDHFHLGNFFNDIMQQLAIYGEVFYTVDWVDTAIEDRHYQLPEDLRYLSTSATFVRKDKNGVIVGYKQQFSTFADLPPSYTNERRKRSFIFNKDEVFHVKYPMDKVSPVKKSMYLLKPILKFWDFALERSASLDPKNKGLNIVRAAQERYSEQKRKYALARAKVRKNFHWLLNTDDLTITEYYDIYLVQQYKIELNKARQYFIDQFNEQIMIPFAQKNELQETPKLTLIGFMTDREIESYFERYKNGEITSKQFIEEVVNKEL